MSNFDRSYVRLTPGVYLHRWRPKLLLVRKEFMSDLRQPDDLSDAEWHMVAGELLASLKISVSEVLSAGIRLTDVTVVKELNHVS